MSASFDPAWVALAFTAFNMVFAAGVFFGGFGPLRRQVEKLSDKIETAGQARENQVTALVEIKTVVATVQEEVRRLRDTRHEENRQTFNAIAEILNKMSDRMEVLAQRRSGGIGE